MNTHMQNPILAWRATKRPDHHRGDRWYLIAGVVVSSIVVFAVLSGEWMMGITVALSAGVFFLVRDEKHTSHSIRIMPLGIEYDGKMTPWDSFKHFWILTSTDYSELHVTRKGFGNELITLCGEVDPFVLRDTLSQFIPQHPEKRERILDALFRYCKL